MLWYFAEVGGEEQAVNLILIHLINDRNNYQEGKLKQKRLK